MFGLFLFYKAFHNRTPSRHFMAISLLKGGENFTLLSTKFSSPLRGGGFIFDEVGGVVLERKSLTF